MELNVITNRVDQCEVRQKVLAGKPMAAWWVSGMAGWCRNLQTILGGISRYSTQTHARRALTRHVCSSQNQCDNRAEIPERRPAPPGQGERAGTRRGRVLARCCVCSACAWLAVGRGSLLAPDDSGRPVDDTCSPSSEGGQTGTEADPTGTRSGDDKAGFRAAGGTHARDLNFVHAAHAEPRPEARRVRRVSMR